MTLMDFVTKGYEFYLAVDAYQVLDQDDSLVSLYNDISDFDCEPAEDYQNLLAKYGDCEIQEFTCTDNHGIYIILDAEVK